MSDPANESIPEGAPVDPDAFLGAAEIRKLIHKCRDILGEQIDHIQILATWNQESVTHRYYSGSGNWHARQGMAHDFIKHNEAQINASEISDALEPPSDGSEEWKKP